MAIRGLGDAFAFQRLLWLLVGTVILPTVLLAVYGVVAIRNERAAMSERVRVQQEARIQWAAEQLFTELDRIDREVHGSARRCAVAPGAQCDVNTRGVGSVWVWPAGSELPTDLQGIGTPIPVDDETAWFTPSDATEPIGLFVQDGVSVAWRLDVTALDSFVGGLDRGYPEDGQVRLELQGSGAATPLEDLAASFDEPQVAVSLPHPLGGYELLVPLKPSRGGLMTLYIAGLVVLVATVLIGTVITLNSAAREIRLSRLQTDFVSHLGHELRTPMTSIRMFIETLQSGRIEDPERIQECLDLLAQESDRLSRRIERVLEWGRMEAGRRVYEFEDLPARDIIDDALAAFESQTLLDESDTRIEVEVPDDLPAVRADRDAIIEALLNLIQNAFKYTPAPRQVRIVGRSEGSEIGLSVTDNGPGIPRHERRRVFEKFYQADTRLSREVEGSGLGLSIVRAVAQGHGGRVELETEVGSGSTFTVWLPAA